MAELAKTARNLSEQIAPVLMGALSSVNQASDFATANQIKNFAKIITLAVKAKEAGMSADEFRAHAELFKMNHMVFTSGSIQFGANVSSGIETTDGKAFDVSFKGGGSVAGFGLEAQAGYKSNSSFASFERSAQNLLMRVDWATVPSGTEDAMIEQLASRVLAGGFDVTVPQLLTDSQSPTLKALSEYLPIIKDLFKKEKPPAPTN